MQKTRKYWLIAILLITLGFGLRLVDLMDPPADFHPTRQFRGAIIARSIYYQLLPDADPQQQALATDLQADFEEFEPPILNGAVALGYLILGQEALWLARLIVSLIWCLGGLALFALVKDSVSSLPAHRSAPAIPPARREDPTWTPKMRQGRGLRPGQASGGGGTG